MLDLIIGFLINEVKFPLESLSRQMNLQII